MSAGPFLCRLRSRTLSSGPKISLYFAEYLEPTALGCQSNRLSFVQNAAKPADRGTLLDRDLEVLAGAHGEHLELVNTRPSASGPLPQGPQCREMRAGLLRLERQRRHGHEAREAHALA